MPLTREELFWAKLQKGNRIQIPVLIRWKYKLEHGELLEVRVYSETEHWSEHFYATILRDGRITVPKLILELMKMAPGDVVGVQINSGEEP